MGVFSFMKSSTCFHLNKKCTWKDYFKGTGVEQRMEDCNHIIDWEPPVFSIRWFLANIVDRPKKQHAPLGMVFLLQIMALAFLFIIGGEHQGGCGGCCCLSRTGSLGINSIRQGFFPAPCRRAAKQSRLNMGSAGRNLQEDIFSFRVFLRSK